MSSVFTVLAKSYSTVVTLRGPWKHAGTPVLVARHRLGERGARNAAVHRAALDTAVAQPRALAAADGARPPHAVHANDAVNLAHNHLMNQGLLEPFML